MSHAAYVAATVIETPDWAPGEGGRHERNRSNHHALPGDGDPGGGEQPTKAPRRGGLGRLLCRHLLSHSDRRRS